MAEPSSKPRGVDFEKIEAALKRAAWKAVHGTREERSGRFHRDARPVSPAEKSAPEQQAAVDSNEKAKPSS